MALPHELVDKVLCHLPVKPLLRFRCVSKGWCSLIDSDAFAKKHLETALECSSGGGIIVNGGEDFYLAGFESLEEGDEDVVAAKIDDPLKTILSGSHFVGAVNGLICVFKNEMNDVFLFNPSTRKSRKIPSSPPEFPKSFSLIESSLCGFGYDEVNDDYKVVKIAQCYSRFRGIMAIVYSLKLNAWTRIRKVPQNIRFIGTRGMFASGSLHWIAIKNPTNAKEIIVGFNLQLQQFMEVPFPVIKRTHFKFNSRFLVTVGGYLCILDQYHNSHMDVWLMKNNGALRTWYKALSVKQGGTLGSFESFQPVSFSRSGKHVLLEVDSYHNTKFVWYELDSKTVKNVRICGIPAEHNSFLYTESLLQPTVNKQLQQKSIKNKWLLLAFIIFYAYVMMHFLKNSCWDFSKPGW